jgi:hypothetical protein
MTHYLAYYLFMLMQLPKRAFYSTFASMREALQLMPWGRHHINACCADLMYTALGQLRNPENKIERAGFWRLHAPEKWQTTG